MGGYNLLTTQYTLPVTDFSNYSFKSNPVFTGTLSVGAIAASSLSDVNSTTQAATDVIAETHSINEKYNNSMKHWTTEQYRAFNNSVELLVKVLV